MRNTKTPKLNPFNSKENSSHQKEKTESEPVQEKQAAVGCWLTEKRGPELVPLKVAASRSGEPLGVEAELQESL